MLSISALFHYKIKQTHTFLEHLHPNVYIFTQMCISMDKIAKFSDIGAVSCGL